MSKKLKNKYQLFESQKIVLIAFILFIIVLSIISSTSNLLKSDAEEAHKDMASIYNKTFSEHLNNSIYNMELFINGIKVLYSKNSDEKAINEYLLKYLRENPYIRSINILDDKTIIKSTNKSNIGLYIDTNNYYPKPLFQKEILRFGDSYIGRDFYDAKEVNSVNLYSFKDSSFFPLSKLIQIDEKKLIVLIALNSSQFLNKYSQNLKDKPVSIEILNSDGKVLISSDVTVKIGDEMLDEGTLNILKEKNSFSGIKSFFTSKKDIVSIELIKNYPLSLCVRFDYDKTLQNWEEKRFNFLFIISILLIFIVILILIFVIKNDKNKQKEIEVHTLEIENQKRFKILFEQNHFLSFIFEENGKINKINNMALSFIGESKNHFVNSYIWDLYSFTDNDKLWLKNAITNYSEGNKIEKEIVMTNSNLERKEIEVIINVMLIDDKKEFVFFGKDITEKKFHEKELIQAYQVFKYAHDGILITDERVNIVNVNDAFIKCTGYQMSEVINKNPSILRSEENSSNFYKDMWEELQSKNYWDGEITNKRKDGTSYVERLTISAVYNKKNKLTNYIGIFSDISKQKYQEKVIKEKERILFQQSKMASMGEMLGNIAHQWRQPLSVISVAAGAIKLNHEYLDTYSNEEVSEFLDSINNSTKYLSETIDDFRNFFTQDIKYQQFDCLNSINMTLKLLSSNFKYKEIDIIFKRVESNYIFASENEFKQIMMNILNNAKDVLLEKNVDKKKYIFISLYFDKKYIYIDILDNAGGIEESIIEKVFEPYFTTKHKSRGTGIGLFMTEEIIMKHMQGDISVSNESFIYEDIEYKGAKFSLKIPFLEDVKN